MLILGIILIVVGVLLPQFHILVTIGIILAIVGAILFLAPVIGLNGGRPIGGRRYY